MAARDLMHQNTKCYVSIAKVQGLLKATSGPWVSAELSDFRLRVFTSSDTPEWVERLRKNLIPTILLGEQLCLHNIKVGVVFGNHVMLTKVENNTGLSETAEDDDKIRLSVALEDYSVQNGQTRLYSFGKLDGLLMKRWRDGQGSLVLIAENGKRIVPRHPQDDSHEKIYLFRYARDLSTHEPS